MLVDENIPSALIASLRGAGHDVAVAAPGTADAALAGFAAKDKRVHITQDKNLANILEYPPKAYAGIILIRFHPPLLEEISGVLDALFARFEPREFSGKLFVLNRDGIRVRE